MNTTGGQRCFREASAGRDGGTIDGVREPPITLTCDCGAATSVTYGARWTCPECGKSWDTSHIPRAEYDQLLRSLRRYRLVTIGPPLALAAVLVPLAIFVGMQFAFLLFVLVMAYALLVLPRIRGRATDAVRRSAATWKLEPE